MFTNALLTTHDITSLIRDTEPYERALFSVPVNPATDNASLEPDTTSRRQTVFAISSGEVTTGLGSTRTPRRNTAVASVLGPELHSQIRKTEALQSGKQADVNVEVLLQGAEKLNEILSVPGVAKKAASLRSRYAQAKANIERYEARVEKQMHDLERMNRGDAFDSRVDEQPAEEQRIEEAQDQVLITEADLRAEEEQIRELERRKKELEDRVTGMERDLGGLMR